MSQLANQLAQAEREEVSRGIRGLLGIPLITQQTAPELFDLIRRRQEPVRKWFDYYCGWVVRVEPRLGYARLVKVQASTDPSRPLRRRRTGRAPFDRRRYTLLCIVIAELLTVPVTTIGQLAERVRQAAAVDDVIPAVDTASKNERRAFVDVLRLLESYGGVEVVDGSTEAYVESEDAKILYRVNTTLLIRLLATPVGPSTLAVPIEEVPQRFEELLGTLTRERRYGLAGDPLAGESEISPTQQNLWLRHTVFRRLVDDPVMYFADLSPAEHAYLGSPTGRQLLRRAAEQGGFILEERAEGAMLVDPDSIATDSRFPDDASTAKVTALLLLDTLTEPATTEQLRLTAGRLLKEHPSWAKAYQDADGPARLVNDALAELTVFGLARVIGGVVTRLPAAGRYAVQAPRTSGQETNP
ncbi:TIGR02678 family protein [Kribbella sp. NPDC026611]|uniref:TIGR02678 family protein n=1 Tax=Kribbella sp. NPDC026611 TaxID=3154911 RepID=UPI00340DE959